MKYYQVSNSAEEHVIGEYPQTTGLFEGYDHCSQNAMENLTSEKFPDFFPDLRFELDRKAKLTDIVSPSNLDFASGLLMNQRCKNVFENFKLMGHKYFEATIRFNLTDIKYHWLHIISPYLSYLDISKSFFWEVCPESGKSC